MIGSGRFGGQQQEDEVDRLIVERVEINSTVQARKQSEQPGQVRQFSMRDSNAIADRGAAELLPLHEDVEYRSFVLSGKQRCARCKLLQHLFLVIDLERRKNRVWRDQIGERHEWNLKDEAFGQGRFSRRHIPGKTY